VITEVLVKKALAFHKLALVTLERQRQRRRGG